MMESDFKVTKGIYPNIILKKKLAPLPLFNQNRSPKHLFQSPTREDLGEPKSTRASSHSTTKLRSPKMLLGELKHVNNYGRLCDQPFLEFSSFHYQQVFGSHSKNKIALAPLQKKKKNNEQSPISVVDQGPKDIKKEPLIKVVEHVEVTQVQAEPVKKPKKEKDTRTIIEHTSKINNHDVNVTFSSLEVVLSPEDQKDDPPFSIFIGSNHLKKIYQYSDNKIEKLVLDSLAVKDGEFKLKIKKNKDKKQEECSKDEPYPEKSEQLQFILSDKKYTARIHYPSIKISVPSCDYNERIMLNRNYLDNLFDEKFSNLSDYKYSLPSEIFKTKAKDDLHHEELEKMPTIVKKVIREKDFGGLLLFKGIEIHLKNISDTERQTAIEDPNLTPKSKKILQKKKKNSDSALLRLKMTDVELLLERSEQEVIEIVKESLFMEEGAGFSFKLNKDKLNACKQRHNHSAEDCLPECSQKFIIEFNHLIYEGFIKFPNLELYVPETSYRDILQLKPSQIKDLLDNEFNNIVSYLKLFKRPDLEKNTQDIDIVQKEENASAQPAESTSNQNDYPPEDKPLTYSQQTISMRKL